jgi:hypothetical protein
VRIITLFNTPLSLINTCRKKRHKMGIGIYLQSKSNKDSQHSLYLRVRNTSSSFTHPLGISLNKKDWDSKNMRVRPKHPLSCEFNKKLDSVRTVAYQSLDLNRAGVITTTELKERVLGRKTSTIKSLLDMYSVDKKTKTYVSYCTAYKSFKAITGATLFKQVNYDNISKAIIEWKRQGKSPSTINNYIRHLNCLKTDAYRRGMSVEPFVKYKSYHQRVAELEVKSITSEEFSTAIGKATTKVERDALTLYLLSFCTRGLYYSDFKTMNPKAVSFEHIRAKTGNRMTISGLDGLVSELYNTIDLKELEESRVGKYSKALNRVLGASFKSARKTYDSYALLCQTDFQIRLHLLGQRDSSIKKYYTNFEMKGIQEEVEKAHWRIINSFDVFEHALLLLQNNEPY